MNNKVQVAAGRLNDILPLKAYQAALAPEYREIHRDILQAYVNLGRSLTRDEISRRVVDLPKALEALNAHDLVVFSDAGEPVGAYPFTMEQREHRVLVNGHLVHCMCALDALAVSPMFDLPVEIRSNCRVTGIAVTIKQEGGRILNADEQRDLHFGISWNAASPNASCANSLCTEMIFLKGGDVADHWCREDSQNREIFTLSDAAGFAAEFFVPLMEP